MRCTFPHWGQQSKTHDVDVVAAESMSSTDPEVSRLKKPVASSDGSGRP